MKRCIRCKEKMDTYMRAYNTTYTVCFDCEIEVKEGYSLREMNYSPPNAAYECKPKQPIKK